MDKESKTPRICKVLGVDIEEKWTCNVFQGNGERDTFRISDDGELQRKNGKGEWCFTLIYANDLVKIINHPEEIKRLSHWTAEDIEDAKAVRRLWPHAITVKRLKALVEICEVIYTSHGDGTYHEYVNYYDVSEDAFPSLKMGEPVTLVDILSGESDG